jgi:hypothetical protein
MKSAIVQFDCVAGPSSFALVDDQFIVKSELTFWLARKISAHLNMSINVST